MRTLDYFYKHSIQPIVDHFEDVSENFSEIILEVLSWLFGFVLVLTLPLWIIPYKLWKKKGGAE